MRVDLLGTGSADGWPNPWCKCASCTWMRAHGQVRGQTAAVVDGRLLLDCGPEVPRAAERLQRSLADVRHLLFTHAHPDHLGPAVLMWRDWTHPTDPLDVVGPPAVIDECRRWVSPAAPVRWHVMLAGEQVRLNGYDVRALPAAHGDATIGPALLYDVTDIAGNRLLWATDTEELPQSTLDAVAGASYGAVFLEETNGDDINATTRHLNLSSWPAQVAELRRRGAIVDATQVVPIHLGHANPPPPALAAQFSAWGAQLYDDGATIVIGQDSSTGQARRRRVLVTGGARSGKSRWAESLLAAEPKVDYIATALPRPNDEEWQRRIDEHRKRRPVHWGTMETLDVTGAIANAQNPMLVECATLWLGAHIDAADVEHRVDELLAAVRTAKTTVVVVTNEVGSGVVPTTDVGIRFRDELGRLNARLARECDEVWSVTAGIPVRLV